MDEKITTAVPDIVWSNNGLDLPQISDIVDGVLADWNNALGGGMEKDLRTPQGQDATSRALIIARTQAYFAALVNQIDPSYSSGRMQDAIGKIYSLSRNPGVGTVVKATCQGSVGTFIPQGSITQDTAGYKYQSLADAVIDSTGNVQVEFQNITKGPFPCGINQLTQIVSQVSGWSSVFNDSIGIVGSNVENRIAFETRRKDSVAKNGINTIDSISATVAAVDGVLDWYIYENFTDATINIGTTNIPVLPHSIYVCVSGGKSDDIANAIWLSKSGGCGVNGNTEVTIYDKNYSQPYPEYVIKYQQAEPTPVFFKINIKNNNNLPSDVIKQIKSAITATFTGTDGSLRARIGSTINSGSFFASIYKIDASDIDVLLINVSIDNQSWQSSVTLGVDKAPTISDDNIQVNLI